MTYNSFTPETLDADRMTLVVGIPCKEGIVMASDTLSFSSADPQWGVPNVKHRIARKIFPIGTSCAIGFAHKAPIGIYELEHLRKNLAEEPTEVIIGELGARLLKLLEVNSDLKLELLIGGFEDSAPKLQALGHQTKFSPSSIGEDKKYSPQFIGVSHFAELWAKHITPSKHTPIDLADFWAILCLAETFNNSPLVNNTFEVFHILPDQDKVEQLADADVDDLVKRVDKFRSRLQELLYQL